MVITRTPFRISFFGGGTDYPEWFREHGGAVLSTAIDKYCYISCRRLPPFFDHTHRIVYSRIENVRHIHEIRHPAVRAVMEWMDIREGLEIHHDGDLPARSGIGSSSAFTVGLINGLRALQGLETPADDLAARAIEVEQRHIQEHVGSQDQIAAAFGGFNCIRFERDESFRVTPVILPQTRMAELRSHLMLFFTGKTRISSDIAKVTISNIRNRTHELHALREMVDEAQQILGDERTAISRFGMLVDESWALKRRLSDAVTTPWIDDLYKAAKDEGAIGGKLLGAGGGGFLLFFAPPETHAAIRQRLRGLIQVPFEFDTDGSKVVFNQPQEGPDKELVTNQHQWK